MSDKRCLVVRCTNEVTVEVCEQLPDPDGGLVAVYVPLCREHHELLFGEVGNAV